MRNVLSRRDVSRDVHEVGYKIYISRPSARCKRPLITKIVSFPFYVMHFTTTVTNKIHKMSFSSRYAVFSMTICTIYKSKNVFHSRLIRHIVNKKIIYTPYEK